MEQVVVVHIIGGGMLPAFRILPSAKTHNKKIDAMLNGKKIFRCQMFGIQIIYRNKNFDMFKKIRL